MGFYDCRCMATGVSLKGVEAALVLLRQEHDAFFPIAFAVKGNYDRLGSIDGIHENKNTKLILDFFLTALSDGPFVVEQNSDELLPIKKIETLLRGFERNINDGAVALWKGEPIVFALFSQIVWDTIAEKFSPPDESVNVASRRLFRENPISEGIYSGSWDDVADDAWELIAVDEFLRNRGIVWRVANDAEQHYSDDMRQHLNDAKRTFSDSKMILKALRNYEREAGDLLEDG